MMPDPVPAAREVNNQGIYQYAEALHDLWPATPRYSRHPTSAVEKVSRLVLGIAVLIQSVRRMIRIAL
jgi:hypothetical protein